MASARNPTQSEGLKKLTAKYGKDRLALVTLDILDNTSIANAVKEAEKLLPNGIDTFISNAAISYGHDEKPGFEERSLSLPPHYQILSLTI